MPYNVTPDLQLQTTIKGDGEAFDQDVINNNFIKLDTRSAQLREEKLTTDKAIQELQTPTTLPIATYSTALNGGLDSTLYNQGTIAKTTPAGMDGPWIEIDGQATGSTTSTTEPRWKFTKRGVYLVNWLVTSNVATTGRTFLEARVNNGSVARDNFDVSETQSNLVAVVIVPQDTGTVLQLWMFKTTNVVSNMSGTVSITKLA